jgi:hypothetical protein
MHKRFQFEKEVRGPSGRSKVDGRFLKIFREGILICCYGPQKLKLIPTFRRIYSTYAWATEVYLRFRQKLKFRKNLCSGKTMDYHRLKMARFITKTSLLPTVIFSAYSKSLGVPNNIHVLCQLLTALTAYFLKDTRFRTPKQQC